MSFLKCNHILMMIFKKHTNAYTALNIFRNIFKILKQLVKINKKDNELL